MSELLTDRQVAERLGVSHRFVQTRAQAGEWPHFRVGTRYRFTEQQFEQILAICEKTPETTTAKTASTGPVRQSRRTTGKRVPISTYQK